MLSSGGDTGRERDGKALSILGGIKDFIPPVEHPLSVPVLLWGRYPCMCCSTLKEARKPLRHPYKLSLSCSPCIFSPPDLSLPLYKPAVPALVRCQAWHGSGWLRGAVSGAG